MLVWLLKKGELEKNVIQSQEIQKWLCKYNTIKKQTNKKHKINQGCFKLSQCFGMFLMKEDLADLMVLAKIMKWTVSHEEFGF